MNIAIAAPALSGVLPAKPAGQRGHGRPWWERRADLRRIVGGCPDHWWKPTAPRTSACTCDRFGI